MALAFAKSHGIAPVDELVLSEERLGKAFSLLEYKVQQLIARQHHELTQLHLRLQEVPATVDESNDLFGQAEIEAEKAAIKAELDAVNAREYEIRSMAVTLLKSLEQTIRSMERGIQTA